MTSISSNGKPAIGLVQFPGSNCDMDCIDTLERHFGIDVNVVWHTETTLPKVDGIVLPGGFSYGDYLRSGGLAAHSKIMTPVREFIKKGGAVIGICNGFQVLTETHILPGALLKNDSQKFVCKFVGIKTAEGKSKYHEMLGGKILRVPIAHGDGRYYIDEDGLSRLKDNGQVLFQYSDAAGAVEEPQLNPNGSVENIAGVVSENGRVLGMMPHPERATDALMGGSTDGLEIWKIFLDSAL